MEIIISTLDAIGTLLIAWAALSVHHRVLNERKISDKVSRIMKVEQGLGIFGMLLILVGYFLKIFHW